jgi:hypothetical protein
VVRTTDPPANKTTVLGIAVGSPDGGRIRTGCVEAGAPNRQRGDLPGTELPMKSADELSSELALGGFN